MLSLSKRGGLLPETFNPRSDTVVLNVWDSVLFIAVGFLECGSREIFVHLLLVIREFDVRCRC